MTVHGGLHIHSSKSCGVPAAGVLSGGSCWYMYRPPVCISHGYTRSSYVAGGSKAFENNSVIYYRLSDESMIVS